MHLEPSCLLGLVSLSTVALVAYYTWVGLSNSHFGGLQEWVDDDFPELVHTPKPTWLTGFRYKRHGIKQFAKFETPIFLEYEQEVHLGRFSAVDTFARSTNAWDGTQTNHDKDLVHYDFGVDLSLAYLGNIAVTEIYKRISITDIEPIIEESACEQETH